MFGNSRLSLESFMQTYHLRYLKKKSDVSLDLKTLEMYVSYANMVRYSVFPARVAF
jgi:hypothetical protein